MAGLLAGLDINAVICGGIGGGANALGRSRHRSIFRCIRKCR